MDEETTNRTAVVVEDDQDIRMLLTRTLSMQGFSVVEAANGVDGLARIREHAPDLVTLDLNLPDLDGTEVCRRLREFSDAYVVMITARADEIDELLGLQIGADDFVTKPFSPRSLNARISAMFRRSRQALTQPAAPDPQTPAAPVETNPPAAAVAPGTTAVHGPVSMDLEARTVHVSGTELALTRTEFDLLAAFIGAPRRVWTRESLLRLVWGDEWATDEHLVEVHIGNLRRKIRDGGSGAPVVRTVRGVGYGLVPQIARS
jgi:two-component system OmpR family response regulator